MAFGIYKASQGYWVRVMTAAFFGVLLLFTASWAWSEAEGVTLPPRAWDLSVEKIRGDIAPGDAVVLARLSDSRTEVQIGTAQVTEFDRFSTGGRGRVLIEQMSAVGDQENFGNVDVIRVSDIGLSSALTPDGSPSAVPASEFAASVVARTSIPVFPQLYLQGVSAGVVLLLGGGLMLYFIGVRPGACEFLIATDGEMKKVNWTSRKEIIGSTQVVVFATFLIAAVLFGIDSAFSQFFTLIGVLEGA